GRIDLNAYDQTKKHRPFLKRVKYREVDGCSLGMWVFKKDTTATNLKPFVFIHGGSWSLRGAGASLGVGMTVPNLTEMGYIVFSPFYRLLGVDDGPKECQKFHGKDIIEDIESAVDWVIQNGESFGMKSFTGEPAKVAIGGQSAGAHLSAYMTTHHPEKIDRAFLLYPPTDFSFFVKNVSSRCGSNCLYSCTFTGAQSPLADFCDVKDFSDLTPTNPCVIENSFPEIIQKQGPENFPPMFILQGSADSAVPIEFNIRLCEAQAGKTPLLNQLYNGCEMVEPCGQKSQIRVVAGAEHMLDLRCLDMSYIKGIPCTPGSKSGQEKVSQYLREAYDTFLSFKQK
ncbi:alpha/beta hydrolase, partial [bacterium]|nr:alpha/beta hydrolase [bacterium]